MTAGEPSLADVQRAHPAWRCWRGIPGLLRPPPRRPPRSRCGTHRGRPARLAQPDPPRRSPPRPV